MLSLPVDSVRLMPSVSGDDRFLLHGGPADPWVLMRPARIRPVLLPQGPALVAAYEVEFLARDPARGRVAAYRVMVSASSGEVLDWQPLTVDASYRVWAEPDGLYEPSDGPLEDVAPHPTGSPDGYVPGLTPPILVSLDGFNSPPGGDPDPWLASGETRTFGNNAQVYVDLAPPDGFNSGDVWGLMRGAGIFDYVYDASAMPFANDTQA